jgi:putative transposase
MSIRSYHVKHKRFLDDLLEKAQQVADYAVKNNNGRKHISTKEVKDIDLPSTIKCQLLRKYGRGEINQASNVHLIVPNSSIRKYTMKDGTVKMYGNIDYKDERVYLKPLKMSFRWNPGVPFEKINQVEISKNRFMITATFQNKIVKQEYLDVLGIDLNCGMGRSIANVANLKTGELLNLGKKGPNVRKSYFKKRKKQKVKGFKEKRKMKDLDHKLSRIIVDYALKNKLKIVVENLKGIRMGARKGNGSKAGNRFVNSWSFYRLQSFLEYKSKELEIPFEKINPQYTSQECSYCQIIGYRKGDTFICKNKHCISFKIKRHSDINAAFNIGQRSLNTATDTPSVLT